MRRPRPRRAGKPDQTALDVVAAPPGKQGGRLLVLYPFGHRLDVEPPRQIDQCLHEGAVVGRARNVLHEGAVDLEDIDAELAASPTVELSLNISPDTTMDPDWWASIESLMRSHPGVAERLIVEITETVAIQDIDDLRGFVTRLKNFGSRIAIDDFGAGYTSFRNLRK
ncbi:MAG: EAL domain-containing protein, partial [Acetobacteraceae bacterium]|nr:EAL domain-containing protein [Acetobacteraceae bacterium]